MKSAASSSALPPISPIMMIDCVSGSARNISSTSMCSVPFTGSPPMPTQDDLAEAHRGRLRHRLIGERARARDDADRAAAMDVARHDADLALARRDDAGAVGTDEARLRARQRALHLDHVEHRDALGDADDERDLGVDRFQDRVGGDRAAARRSRSRWRRWLPSPRAPCRRRAGPDASRRLCRARCRRPSWCRRRWPARNGTCPACR